MTGLDETRLRHALADQANDLGVSDPPYYAIVRDGRALRRRRTMTRAALAVTAVAVPALTLALTINPTHDVGPVLETAPTATPARTTPPVVHSPQAFTSVDDPKVPADVRTTTLKGTFSGVEGEVLVWLPPQYDDPAYRDRRFPVVELVAGQPGSSATWFGTLRVSDQLKPMITDGSALPFILVSPRVTNLNGVMDTGCADVPGKPRAETWLARDVPQLVLDNLRADPSPRRWAVAGYSAGGHCATRLALAHPDRYSAAVSISGYNDPGVDPESPVGRDPGLRESANPLNMLRSAASPPRVAVYASGAKGDGLEDARALELAAKAPTSVTPVETPALHDTAAWRATLPDVLRWLSRQLN